MPSAFYIEEQRMIRDSVKVKLASHAAEWDKDGWMADSTLAKWVN